MGLRPPLDDHDAKLRKFQDTRRAEALQRQREARASALSSARSFAQQTAAAAAAAEAVPAAAAAGADASMSELAGQPAANKATGRAAATPRPVAAPLAPQLMQPEWLLDAPPNLPESWLVAARPEGLHCSVCASKGRTVATRRGGGSLGRSFASPLPNGSPATQEATDAFTLLDCVLCEADSTFYITDAMVWRGYSLYDCTSEFRLFFLTSKLAELVPPPAPATPWPFRFQPLPFSPATPEALRWAGCGLVDPQLHFPRDGILLRHREALYFPCPSTPLLLRWKDASCSRYPIDTEMSGAPMERPRCFLRLGGAVGDAGAVRPLLTADDPPVLMGWAGAACAPGRAEGTLIRLEVLRADEAGEGAAAQLLLPDGLGGGVLPMRLLGEGGGGGGARGRSRASEQACTASRVLFQLLARAGRQVTMEGLAGA